MIISMRHLVDRLRTQRSRADEVATLRRQLAAQPGGGRVIAEEREAAEELRALRLRLAAAIADHGGVRSCFTCARGHPPPHGRWEGGHCCGAPTFDLFNDDEVAALRLGGTTPGGLRLPVAEDHAGCAFRGPRGCSLRAVDRPNICVRYVCPDLARELHGRGDLEAIEALGAQMEQAYLRFATARARRLEAEDPF